ncbi:MAG: helix-turn-helix domain-containing protein [Chloroflexota bacterium]|nr:helix-turn-helix domain-containing protein [Chloroflexota bacterium]
MSNHTGTVRACQDRAPVPRPESTPPPLDSIDSIDRRLVQRYGAWLLTGGYTALPTYAWVYYARLGVSEAEMVCLAQLCTYWWSARDPFPGEAALAIRMGKTVRTIQGYLRSLEAKGLLHIQTRLSTNGRQSTNAYDLRPFFAAVEGLARLDGLLPDDAAAPPTPPTLATPATPATPDNNACTGGPCDHHNRAQRDAERGSLCADATSVRNRQPAYGRWHPDHGRG